MAHATNVHSSLWERYKAMIYQYGHYYATIFGLVMINYIPTKSTNTWSHRVAVFYSHFLAFMLIIVLPVYFGSNLSALIETNDRQFQLHLQVTFVNTVLKWATVVLTYAANLANYNAIRNVTTTRQSLEDTFGLAWKSPRRRFERALVVKFALINLSMLVQLSNIAYQYCLEGAHSVRGQFAIYAFVLWNYTENMADYFYFMLASSLKFYRQLQWNLMKIYKKTQWLQRNRGKSLSFRLQFCFELCDQLDELSELYKQICLLCMESLRMQELQFLGLVLATFLSNLTNLFTIFTLLSAESSEMLPLVILTVIHAMIFYSDAYIITEIAEQILIELQNIRLTLWRFNEFENLDLHLDHALEQFSMRILMYKIDFCVCDFFYLNRRLAFLTASSGLQYFITLIQVAINWNRNYGK